MNMKNSEFNPREYMEMAIDVMKSSILEQRKDKARPNVGAVIIKPDGVVDTAFRGEYRSGDHAEFTLLDRKYRNEKLDGSILFTTLEPCAPGSRNIPKLSCAERIVNARIKKVWVGIEDPDPLVDRKGIEYLIDQGIEVEMFDPDLQTKIRESNLQFIAQAEERAKSAKEEIEVTTTTTTTIENPELNSHLNDFSKEEIEYFISKARLEVSYDTPQFYRTFEQLGYIETKEGILFPTGIGLLLFGKRPQLVFPNALIRATFTSEGRGEDIETFEGSIVKQIERIQNWYETRIGKQISRDKIHREIIYDYPLVVFREAIINSVVHRDYEIQGAPIYFEINDNSVVIKSPGKPVPPIRFEQIQRFNAPSLSRNPKLMYAFDQLELVEQRGLGFKTIKELPVKYNLPLPIVTFEDPYLVFTFPRSSDAIKELITDSKLKELNNEEIAGYDFIKIQGKLSRKEYEQHFKYDTKKAERHFKHFVELGLVKRMGSGPSTYYEYITTV